MLMEIKLYGASWCSDCVRTKSFLDIKAVDYEYIDITDNNEAIAFVEKINKGKRVIPVLMMGGVSYTNPSIDNLKKILHNKL